MQLGIYPRFIPTHVGHTTPAGGVYEYKDGSSPRMWGIPLMILMYSHSGRFIPTHVGHTKSWRLDCWSSTVHPHACGAYYNGFYIFSILSGSSPRMWGIRSSRFHRISRFRFIPTHVGHTVALFVDADLAAVHPHACGAYFSVTFRQFFYYRFIPTHVGHTSTA